MGIFKKALPILGLFFLTVAFFGEAIFCGKTFFFWDAAHFFYPMKHFIAETVKSGHLPLWNPYIHSGMPQIANLESGFFYPLSVIFYLFPFDLAYRLFVISHYFLAGLFMYLLLRHWNLSRYSAFFSGVVFMFSGYLVSMSNGINILSSAVWAPLIFLFLDKAIRAKSLPIFLLTGLLLSIQFLSGDPVNTYFTALICFLYLIVHIVGLIKGTKKSQVTSHKSQVKSKKLPGAEIFDLLRGEQGTEASAPGGHKGTEEEESTEVQRVHPPACRQEFPPLLKGGLGGFKGWSRKEEFSQGFILLFFFLLAGVTAILLSACQLLPSIEFTRLSTRCLGLTYAHASHWSLEPSQLLTFFAPYLFGNTAVSPLVYNILFKTGNPFFFSIYLGILPLCLSLIAILFVRKKQVRFFFFILVFSIILALGKYTPIHYLFWRYLPFYSFFRYPVKAVYLISISVSILVGFGLEWLLKNRRNRGLKLFSKIFFSFAALLFLIFLGFYLWPGQVILFFGRFLNLEFPRDLFAWAHIIDSLFSTGAVILLTAGVILFGTGRRVKLNVLKVSLAGLLIADLFFTNLSILALSSPDFYTRESKSVRFLKADKEFYRLYRSPLDLGNHARKAGVISRKDYYAWVKEIVSPNLGTIYGLFYADGSEAAHLLRYSLVLTGIESTAPIERTRLLGLLNVKYIFSAEPLKHPELNLVKEVGDNVKIYENLAFLPRVFAVKEAVELRSPYEVLKRVCNPEIDLRKEVVLDLSCKEGWPEDVEMAERAIFKRGINVEYAALDCLEKERRPGEAGAKAEKDVSPGSAQIVKYESTEAVIDTVMESQGYLVLTDTYYPGWKVWVDGRPAGIFKANYVFRAVALEKGKHRVRFVYDPMSVKLGIAVSGISIILLGMYFLKHIKEPWKHGRTETRKKLKERL